MKVPTFAGLCLGGMFVSSVSVYSLTPVPHRTEVLELDRLEPNIPLAEELIPFHSTWRYSDDGAEYDKDWLSPRFDDQGWKQGRGQLGFGDGDEATVLTRPSANLPSVLFRKVVRLPRRALAAELRVVFDDGIVVWINGEIVLSRRASDTRPRAFADSRSLDNEAATVTLDPDHLALMPGDNLVAVMVKQVAGISSDLSFNLSLDVAMEAERAPSEAGAFSDETRGERF